MKPPLYPLQFTPITKYRIWGGNRLNKYVPKGLQKENLGEIWSISDVPGDISRVQSGALIGVSLDELIRIYKEKLLGERLWKSGHRRFPLLIKFIDSLQPLSVQVHPDDKLAEKRHHSRGKTEMWYIMEADPGSELTVGFKDGVKKEDYLKHLGEESLENILQTTRVHPGDAVFIPAGRVHAIGAGVTLAEIQQTSDITYRIYDYNRIDKDGKKRQLHTESALEAIDFSAVENIKTPYSLESGRFSPLISCDYFETKISQSPLSLKIDSNTEMRILICTQGKAEVRTPKGSTEIKAFESILIPAIIDEFEIISEEGSLLIEVIPL